MVGPKISAIELENESIENLDMKSDMHVAATRKISKHSQQIRTLENKLDSEPSRQTSTKTDIMDCNSEINDIVENSGKEMANHEISKSNEESAVSNEMMEQHLNEMMKKSQEIYTGEGQFTSLNRTEFPLQKDQPSKDITKDSAINKTVLPCQQNVILVKIPNQYLDYICQFCSKDFSIPTEWQHLPDSNRSSEDLVPPTSNMCKKETKFTCEICGVKFVHGATYRKHSLIYHEKSIPQTWTGLPRSKRVQSKVKTTEDDKLTEID
ncbi:unnamed protein product [Mytilus coruscus]|uniref:C2H2-type domain-containing protein n=1 Tax=Mytilus coruscus TaxID=42192 RepID=A0A6J8DPB6_MYTCO|nr:unnamed protein product [Mytilus coruscus]